MSAIFLSHSSADSEVVAEIKEWLFEKHQHQSIFLDFDPEGGIPAGRDWEGELYRQLGACRAVVALCSEASMSSRWCFAEIALARSMGKPVFPILVEPCEVIDILKSVQIIDLAEGRELARKRLSRALKTAGLHSADLFGWDVTAGRSPYPGLAPFEERDAGVFFGRDLEIGEGLERLNQIRRHRGAGMLMVLGGSGSGKSSLVRAGLIPRLRLDEERWIVLTPSRLGSEPHHALAKILAEPLRDVGRTDTEQIRMDLSREMPIEEGVEVLVSRLVEIQSGSKYPNSRVLLVIDQFEELLQQPPDHPAHEFLNVLRLAVDREGSPLVVMATMRSDYLGEFLQHPALKGLAYGNLTVGPMSVENLRQLIELPARLTAIDLEDGLIDNLLQDADTDYALPLLAFTLRELYDGYVDDTGRLIKLHHYRDLLGGIEGAIKKAVDRRLPPVLSEDQEEALRRAFLAMVRLDRKGRVSRRTVRWSEIETLMGGSEPAEQLLGPFVDGLLLRPGSLAGGERAVEVTHEALFSNWDQLNRWIHDQMDELKLRDRLVEAARQWMKGRKSPEDLLTQKVRLGQALELVAADRVPLSAEVRWFVEESKAQAERQEVRRARRRQLIVGAAVVSALVMAFLWSRAEQAREKSQRAEEEARAQVSRFLAAETDRQDLDLSLLLALEAYRSSDTLEARNAMAAKIFERPRLERFLHGHSDWVSSLAVSVDGASLVSTSRGGRARIWNIATGASRTIGEGLTDVRAMARSRDGRTLVLAYSDGSLTVFGVDLSAGSVIPRHAILTGDVTVEAVAISPDGESIAAALPGGTVRFWSTVSAVEILRPIRSLLAEVRSLMFSRDGRLLAAGDAEGELRAWSLSARDGPAEVWGRAGNTKGEIVRVTFSPAENGLLAWAQADDAEIHYCDLTAESSGRYVHCSAGDQTVGYGLTALTDLAFSPDGRYIAASGQEATGRGGTDRTMMVWLWEVEGGQGVRLRHGRRAVDAVAFVGDGSTLVTGSRDGTIRLWSVVPPRDLIKQVDFVDALGVPFEGSSSHLAVASGDTLSVWDRRDRSLEFSAETGFMSHVALTKELLAGGGDDGVLRVWSLETGRLRHTLEGGAAVTSLGVDPTGEWIAIGRADGVIGLWRAGESALAASVRLGSSVVDVAFRSDGAQLVAVAEDGSMATWPLVEGRPGSEASAHSALDEPTTLSIRADGRRIAAATGIGEVLLWDPSSWEATRLPGHPVHEHSVSSIMLSSDGRYLASGSSLVHVWNLELDRLEFTLPEPDDGGEVTGLAFDSDSTHLILGRLDEVWQIPLAKSEWQLRACERASRQMTATEWAFYVGPDTVAGVCADLPMRETAASDAASGASSGG